MTIVAISIISVYYFAESCYNEEPSDLALKKMLEADSHNVIVNKDGKEVIVSDLILSKLNLFKNEKAFKQKDKSRRKRKAIEGAGV